MRPTEQKAIRLTEKSSADLDEMVRLTDRDGSYLMRHAVDTMLERDLPRVRQIGAALHESFEGKTHEIAQDVHVSTAVQRALKGGLEIGEPEIETLIDAIGHIANNPGNSDAGLVLGTREKFVSWPEVTVVFRVENGVLIVLALFREDG